jgi:hypothetical protein
MGRWASMPLKQPSILTNNKSPPIVKNKITKNPQIATSFDDLKKYFQFAVKSVESGIITTNIAFLLPSKNIIFLSKIYLY